MAIGKYIGRVSRCKNRKARATYLPRPNSTHACARAFTCVSVCVPWVDDPPVMRVCVCVCALRNNSTDDVKAANWSRRYRGSSLSSRELTSSSFSRGQAVIIFSSDTRTARDNARSIGR